MNPRRLLALTSVVVGLAAGCTGAQSSASRPEEPLPTIGLGSPDFGSFTDADGAPVGGAEVVDPNVIDAEVSGVPAVGAEEVDTIVMIGDSVTVASTPALRAQFAAMGFDEPVIVAQEGKRMAEAVRDNPSGAAVAEVLTGGDAALSDDRANELWIIALGTNDIGQYDADEVAAAVNEVLANVPADAPLVWVDTHYRDEPAGETRVNDIIADRVGRRGNAVVAPWSFFAAGDGVLRVDGVHPSSSGSEVFAAVVAETAARFLGR